MLLYCTRCATSLPVRMIKAGESAGCPACSADLTIRVFPALLVRRAKLNPGDLRIDAGESSCFYHESKRATASCGKCGRFVCALCAVDFDGASWCPRCLADARAGKKNDRLENRRVLWDSIALGTATLPLLMFWTALPGSFAALYIAIRYRNRPGSLIPRWKWRTLLSILIALAEIVLFGILIYALATQARK